MNGESIEDQYDFEQDTTALKEKIMNSKEPEQQNSFLNVYKEQPESEQLPDETPKEISFKPREEEDMDLALPGQKTDGKKPMI